MKKALLLTLACMLWTTFLAGMSWADCPEDPTDRGECDTLTVTCIDCDREEGESGPWLVRFPLLVTHDQTEPDDSIGGFTVPLTFTHTNPAAFCSVSAYWNGTEMGWWFPTFGRSVFRHMFETDYPDTSGELYRNRMALLEGDFSNRGWDFVQLTLDDTANFWFTIVPINASNQGWWEGDRVLLATISLMIEDTMHVCFDSTFWPPATSMSFSRWDAVSYVPRSNMPACFWVGPPQPAAVAVTSPNGGEEWCVGSSQNITWTSSGIESVQIEYSTNGGSNWTSVGTVSAASGSYPWTVPDASSTDCLVRICDSDDQDPCDESDAAFTIQDTPAAPSDCAASDDLCDKVQFSWTDNSDNETKFYIYRDAALFDSVDADVESYDDLTATGGTTYEYCVSALNECGESGQCCDNGIRQTIPSAPTDCAASDDLCDKIELSWTDNSSNETKFYIYRDAALFDSVDADVESYDDLTATGGTTYEYCVAARNQCGESTQSCDNGTRLSPPVAPSDCVASDDLCDKVSFSWTDNSADEIKFYIYRDAALLDSVDADVESYDDLTATAGATYEYCVAAYNECGESGQCCDNGTRLSSPTAPSDCAASDDLCDKVQFSWTDNSDNETKFYIYRDAALFDSVDADVESYDDLTATGGTTYEYCVSALNECGESGQCCDNGIRQTIPSAPTDCAATDDLCDKVQFTWTDNSDNETGFYIYRDGVEFDTLAAGIESYDDPTASPGATYRYCVSAFNACGVSDSCCDDGTREAPPDAPTDVAATDDLCDKVQITWTDASDDESGFVIYRESTVLDSVDADVELYDDATATPGATYEYCVSAYKDCGESSQSCDNGTRKDAPMQPSDCVASDDLCDSVHVCWTDNSGDEIRFYLYRDAVLVDSVEANIECYDDLTASPGVTYEYCVTALNECGESSPSCDDGTVQPEAVTVTDPNGGESWIVGDSYNITWNSDCLDNVKIEYSTDNGSNWTDEITSTPAGPGTYSWTIPDEPSDQCLVRVSDADDGSPSDVSDQVFSIVSEDFAIDVSPDTLVIMRTTSGDSFTVELTSILGFDSPCTLSVTGLPTDASGEFHPATLVPTGTAYLAITAEGTTPYGHYTLTVTATEMSGAKALQHSTDVVIYVVLPTWGFELEADPDSLEVVAGTPANCDITMLPDVGYTAPCTLSVESGLPAGATAAFSDTVIYPYDISILTINTDGTTPPGRYEINVRGVASFKEQEYVDVVLVVLVVEDFSFSAIEDSLHVTQGQTAGFVLEFESLFGFSDPCTLTASGLPMVDSAVFDPPRLDPPTGSVLFNVYTAPQTPEGRHVLTVTAQSQPGGKPTGVQHSIQLILMVEEYSDVDDWTDDFNRPQSFALFQNQPNPFNPETKISYFLPQASQVSINIYNVLGQRVRRLFEDYQEAGTYSLTWDGRTDDGMQLSSGIYFYRMQAGSFQETKKMTLMK